jgi:diguanylate cyclase (GGDEF)-like protein
MDVVDPLSDEPSCLEDGNHHLVNRLKTGDLLGEMGLLRSVPRSATIIATEPVELLQINWKMIRRLQWLYPPTAHKFFHNLLTIICDRLEKVTDCLSEVKTVDDATGLPNRETFLKILNDEIHRSQRYGTKLSLCLMEFDVAATNPVPEAWYQEAFLRSLSESLSRNIRNSDILGRFDHRSFALLVPQTSALQTRRIYDRLQDLLEKEHLEKNGVHLVIKFGLAELNPEKDQTGSDLMARAAESLRGAKTLH